MFSTLFQENTLEIISHSAKNVDSFEIDLMQLKSGEDVLYHYKNFLDKGGIDKIDTNSSWDEIKNYNYLSTNEYVNYNINPRIPLLKEGLDTVCSLNNY